MLRKDPFITGEYYHIYNRGIDKRVIFKLPRDYERFMMLLYLANSQESFRLDNLLNQLHKTFTEIMFLDKGEPLVSIGAWCLMTNHFHLLIKQEVDGGITKVERRIKELEDFDISIIRERWDPQIEVLTTKINDTLAFIFD